MPQVVDGALWLLSRVTHLKFPPVTTGVSVEANLLDHIVNMLEAPNTPEWRHLVGVQILSNLALHESTIAVAIVEADLLNSVEKLLRSCPPTLYKHIFPMLESLVSHQSTVTAIVRVLPFDLLGPLWRQSINDALPIDRLATRWKDLVTTKLLEVLRQATAEATCSSLVALVCAMPQVVDGALWLLSRAPHIKFPPVTTGVSVEAKLLDQIVDMLKAPNTEKWRYQVIFQLLSHLALHESSAVAIVEANVLNSTEKLLNSCPTDLYKHIFPMLKSLASYESTAIAVIRILPLNRLGILWHQSMDNIRPKDGLAMRWEDLATTKLLEAPCQTTVEATCSSLVAVVCDSDTMPGPVAVEGALWLLSRTPHIKFLSVTAGVSAEEKLLDHIVNMLKAPNTANYRYLVIFQILSNLALHESTAVAVVEANILNLVEKLLRSCPADLYQHIFPLLENLASYKSTAMAVIRILPHDLIGRLWRKSVDDTAPMDILARLWEDLVTTKLLSAQHKATAEATSSSLVANFCDSDIPQVVDGALWLLSCAPHIKFPPVTTGISVEAKLLDHIVDMLEAPNTAKWRYLVIFQILSNLALHESGAVAVVEAHTLNSVQKLLRSHPTDLYQHIFSMLENLASHESAAMAILHMIPLDLFSTRFRQSIDDTLPIDELAIWWEDLVTMKLLSAQHKATADATLSSLVVILCDSDIPPVVDGTLWLLSCAPHIKFPLVTTGVPVEAKLLDHIVNMLKAPNTANYRYLVIFQILSNLALHESTAVAIVAANILNAVENLLISRPTDLYWHIFSMLENLACHESTAMVVFRMLPLDLLGTLWRESADGTAPINPLAMWWEQLVMTKLLDALYKAAAEATCSSLVALVCDSDMPLVVEGALWILSRVPRNKILLVMTGASEAKLLDRVVNMLEAPDIGNIRHSLTLLMLRNLALHESSAVAIVDANILTSIEKLLRSQRTDLHSKIHSILSNLVSHESTATAVPDMCRLLATLWCESPDTNMSITNKVIHTLTRIVSFPGGAEGVVTTKSVDYIHEGFQSSNPYIRLSTCELLRALVGHESTVQAVAATVQREDIVALLSDRDSWVRERATGTLEIFDATPEIIARSSRNE
ncbi:hypothetical protein C8J57DRAFT_1729831 [Mycena rebaudengoi]|nr:hypothetical protein C8J57DRAFT_1729831 [Mycena rebaudengoi]